MLRVKGILASARSSEHASEVPESLLKFKDINLKVSSFKVISHKFFILHRNRKYSIAKVSLKAKKSNLSKELINAYIYISKI